MLKNTVFDTLNGISAGIVISIGGTVFLTCDNKAVGAVLFTVALLCICLRGYSLFTGKVGFITEKHGKAEFSVLLLGLLGNVLATWLCGALLKGVLPDISEKALIMCEGKLNQTVISTFVRGIFCGILMYLAVSTYRDKNTLSGILFCVPVFILSGFEHSIADMFYFAVAGCESLRSFGFIVTVIIGNAIGAILMNLLSNAAKPAKTTER